MISSGVINIYKEAGLTSFGVVARLRKILGIKKIGHTGTLDPDAVGVLPICFGKATKLVEELSHKDKVYETTLLLGQSTDTQDISGKIILSCKNFPSDENIINAVNSFVGEIEQVAPMYSAKRINGKRLYELARMGMEVERKPSKVNVYSIDILSINVPRVRLRIHCSTGTYIRTICNDIGDKLGCGGCMEELTRTKVYDFDISRALKPEEIQEKLKAGDESFIIPVDFFYQQYFAIKLNNELTKIAVNGGKIKTRLLDTDNIKNYGFVRLYRSDNSFIGVYSVGEEYITPYKMYLM